MEDQLSSCGLSFEFMRAIDGRAGEHLSFPYYSDDSCVRAWRRPLTPGEVGCFASHYSLWRRCVEKNEPLVVLEDDIEIGQDFEVAVRNVIRIVKDHGYVRLSGIVKTAFRRLDSISSSPFSLVRFLRGPMGTQCYAISPSGAGSLLRHAEKWDLPVDNYIDAFWRHNVLSLGLLPFPVVHLQQFGSDISSNGISPSEENRGRVWRPKRFVARKFDDARRALYNLQN
jgi:glycosyl transferase family 25